MNKKRDIFQYNDSTIKTCDDVQCTNTDIPKYQCADVFRFGNFETKIRNEIQFAEYIPNVNYYIFENQYIEEVLDSINNNENILFVGYPGTGKSSLVLYLASVCKVPIVQIQGSGEMSEVDIIGGFQNISGNMVWVDGLIPFALKNGFWILIDEINMVLPEILARLHSVLDDRRHLDLREINQVIKVTEKTIIFATMNPYDVGTKPLSASLWSRFHIVVPFDYLSFDNEVKLLIEKVNCSKEDAECIVSIANLCRDAYRKNEMSKVVDTRMVLACGKKVKSFEFLKNDSKQHIKRAFHTTILSKLSYEDQSIVNCILTAKGIC